MGMFGFSLSGSKQKSKTTTTNLSNSSGSGTFSNTTTPTLPDWATSAVRGATGRAESLMDRDPTSFVAGPNALQQQAAAGAPGLSDGAASFDAARGLTQGAADTSWLSPHMTADTPFASGGKAYNYVDRYLNPYLHDVVDASAADFDAHGGQVRAQQALDLAGSGAFGGSGAALTQSMTEGELARARASTLSGLRSHGYDTALGAAAGDADRATQARIANAQTALQDRAQKVGFGFQGQQLQLQTANQLANLTASQGNEARANIATQAGVGDSLRNIAQQQAQAPLTTNAQIAAMLSGLPISLFAGKTEEGTSSNASTTSESGTSKTKGTTITATGEVSGG